MRSRDRVRSRTTTSDSFRLLGIFTNANWSVDAPSCGRSTDIVSSGVFWQTKQFRSSEGGNNFRLPCITKSSRVFLSATPWTSANPHPSSAISSRGPKNRVTEWDPHSRIRALNHQVPPTAVKWTPSPSIRHSGLHPSVYSRSSD